MRDRTPKEAPPKVEAPSTNKLAQLHALAGRIESHRGELDAYLDEYAALITPNGVPQSNVRMMLDAKGRCLCGAALFAISERIEALLLEEKQQNGVVSEE